jgi:hypothetical protein
MPAKYARDENEWINCIWEEVVVTDDGDGDDDDDVGI